VVVELCYLHWFSCALPPLLAPQWDDVIIGDGTPGLVALQIKVLMEEDMRPGGPGVGQHVEVPYGYLTHMEGECRGWGAK
jgi:hypothetical protein